MSSTGSVAIVVVTSVAIVVVTSVAIVVVTSRIGTTHLNKRLDLPGGLPERIHNIHNTPSWQPC